MKMKAKPTQRAEEFSLPSERAMETAHAIQHPQPVPSEKTHAYATLAREQRRLQRIYDGAKLCLTTAKAQLDEHEAYMLTCLGEDKLQSIRIRGMNFTLARRDIAEIFDRDKYFAYACLQLEDGSHPNTDLLHKRISMEAARERWMQGVKIPGVRPGTVPYLSVTKAAVKARTPR